MQKAIIVFLVLAGLSIALHIAGWELFTKPAGGVDPGGSGFAAPDKVGDLFGPAAANMFPAIVVSICTLLGILAQILMTRAQQPGMRLTMNTFAPFLISPIVIHATHTIAAAHPDGFVAALMAFQNGFFWQAIFGHTAPAAREDTEASAAAEAPRPQDPAA
ncbi:hypothetical protein [Henriciella aquimarina]|uniref:hypothetical protein n=1 Tax=Henriciella aquimarina TaxID=545261 RepID=UPI000A02C138|nr:hypothetical protein [Henriciella aquimarina]